MKKIFSFLFIIFGSLIAFQTSALTLSPAKIEIDGDPGSVLSGVINLYNEQENTEIFYTSSENFEPGDDSGTPRFIGAEGGLATWISTQESVSLNPQERAEVPFKIAIPAGTEPGGYFAALFFGNQPQSDAGQVSIGGRIGVLILLRVNGDISENGETTFGTKDNNNFFDTTPVSFEYRFSNNGGDRVVPRGDIVIKNIFGTETATLKANEIDGSVLPGSGRRFTTVWGEENTFTFFEKIKHQMKNFHFGYYTAHLNLGWGVSQQTSHNTTSFFMVPWQLLLIILALIGFVLFVLKKILKSYKAALIKEIQKQQSLQGLTDVEQETVQEQNVDVEAQNQESVISPEVPVKEDDSEELVEESEEGIELDSSNNNDKDEEVEKVISVDVISDENTKKETAEDVIPG
jgi:hypothetical protein